jgi:hypothetical protein
MLAMEEQRNGVFCWFMLRVYNGENLFGSLSGEFNAWGA